MGETLPRGTRNLNWETYWKESKSLLLSGFATMAMWFLHIIETKEILYTFGIIILMGFEIIDAIKDLEKKIDKKTA